jgi:hypothetical protein
MSVVKGKVNTATRPKTVAEAPVTSVLAGGEVPDLGYELTPDEEVLAALGYR